MSASASGAVGRRCLPGPPAAQASANTGHVIPAAVRQRNPDLARCESDKRGHRKAARVRQFWVRRYDWMDPHYWYYTNLEDPIERGYDAIRRLLLIEMARVSVSLK